MSTYSDWHNLVRGSGYTQIDSTPFCDVFRGPDGQIYVDWSGTTAPYAGSAWSSLRAFADMARQWVEDFEAMDGDMPRRFQDAIRYIEQHYGPESSTVHHFGYSRGGAFAQMFGGRGYGSMTNPAMPQAPGSEDNPGEDWIHNLIHNWPHVPGGPFTPNPSQAGIPNQTPTTPVGPLMPPSNVIEMFGHDDDGHSLIAAHPAMPFGASSYAGSLSGRSRFRSSYPANQTRRKTEQFGDLNAYNRVYQFYNYHGEKKQMLEEYCRGLVLSLVRIQKGVVHDYEDPIAWPFPVHQPEAQITGGQPQDNTLDTYLNWIEFHFKDARRDGGFYGKTLGNRTGTEGDVVDEEPLAEQYQYDININKPTCVPLWEYIDPQDVSQGRRMKSLTKLAADITEIFESLAYLDTNFQRAHDAADPEMGTPHIDTLDIRPTRVMLVKSLKAGGKITHDVIYDDEQFASSRVDIGSYTTVTIHNVSPASGDIAVAQDPMAADTITHVPLVGKMYTFSGSCPKVWDKHKADLHQLFNPLFFRMGRYRLPQSKIHDLDQFKSPPRGRAIWSNCIGESRISIGPGQIKKLRMNFRIRDSLGEFWQKYRDHYLSDSRLGRTVCLCLEPLIRRQHVGEPVPVALMKEMDEADIGNFDITQNPPIWDQPSLRPLNAVVEYQPYELQQTSVNGVVSMRKHLRYAFRLTTAAPNTADFFQLGNTNYPSPPVESGAIRYYFYSAHDPDKRLCVGRAVHPSTPVKDPNNPAINNAICLPDPTAPTTLTNPDGSQVNVGDWRAALWTDDPARVAKGDPMMFNIQINRLLHARTKLKKFHALGADKTGIKRKWDERLKSVLGADLFGNPLHAEDTGNHDDAPRDIDMFNQAGIRAVIAEGDAGNISVAAAPAVNVTVQGVTQSEMQTAMEDALTAAHPLADAVYGAGHAHEGKLKLDHHPLASATVNPTTGGLVVDTNQNMQLAMEQALYNPAYFPGSDLKVREQNPNSHNLPTDLYGNIRIAEQFPQNVALNLPTDAQGNLMVAEQNPVTTVNLTPGQTVGVTGTVGITPGTTVPVSVPAGTTVPVNVGSATVPVDTTGATVPVDTTGASVPVTGTVGITPGTTVPVSVPAGTTVPVNVGSATVPVDTTGATVPVNTTGAAVPITDPSNYTATGVPITAAQGVTVETKPARVDGIITDWSTAYGYWIILRSDGVQTSIPSTQGLYDGYYNKLDPSDPAMAVSDKEKMIGAKAYYNPSNQRWYLESEPAKGMNTVHNNATTGPLPLGTVDINLKEIDGNNVAVGHSGTGHNQKAHLFVGSGAGATGNVLTIPDV